MILTPAGFKLNGLAARTRDECHQQTGYLMPLVESTVALCVGGVSMPPDQLLMAARGSIAGSGMLRDRPVSEQPREHSKSMIGQRLVNKRFLTFHGLQRTAARLSVIVERRIDQFRKKFADCTQARGASPIP